MAKSDKPILLPVEIRLEINPQIIEDFNANSQEGTNWGSINFPFSANSLTKNVDGLGNSVSWFQKIGPGQTMDFKFSTKNPPQDLTIEFVRLNPLGEINYSVQGPNEAWSHVLDLAQTSGSIGDYGSYYLSNVDTKSTNPCYRLVTSTNLSDFSPNLSYTILFSFTGATGVKHYCTIDPLIKTTARNT